jgi:hypothetical protein
MVESLGTETLLSFAPWGAAAQNIPPTYYVYCIQNIYIYIYMYIYMDVYVYELRQYNSVVVAPAKQKQS